MHGAGAAASARQVVSDSATCQWQLNLTVRLIETEKRPLNACPVCTSTLAYLSALMLLDPLIRLTVRQSDKVSSPQDIYSKFGTLFTETRRPY